MLQESFELKGSPLKEFNCYISKVHSDAKKIELQLINSMNNTPVNLRVYRTQVLTSMRNLSLQLLDSGNMRETKGEAKLENLEKARVFLLEVVDGMEILMTNKALPFKLSGVLVSELKDVYKQTNDWIESLRKKLLV